MTQANTITQKISSPRVVFFGTPEIGAVVLEALVKASIRPVFVVTMPDKPADRGQKLTSPPVKLAAQRFGIPVLQPQNLQTVPPEIAKAQPDLFVVAAYGKFLPLKLLQLPSRGTLNIHPSLLPRHRGPSPIQTAILEGDEKTGVTIILLDEEMDHGPIVAQQVYTGDLMSITTPVLKRELGLLAGEMLVRVIPQWVAGNIQAVSQDHSKATRTKMFMKEDGKIDWRKPAQYIERQIRAFTPWPGTFALFAGKNLKVLKALTLPTKLSETKFSPGTVFLTADKKLAIQCREDALIVEELQLEGGKPMSSKEFLLGHKDIVGSTLNLV